jgi:predicted TIM-barrel fold metal-dependent hydrolase
MSEKAEKPSYPLFDADNHYYEPRDCFSRYIEPKHRAKAIRVEQDSHGRDEIWVGDKPFTFLLHNFDRVPKAGALKEMLKAMRTPDYAGQFLEDVQPEFVDREARLKRMDQQGIESCFMFPTLGVCLEHFMIDDAEQMYANMHSFNRWLLEDWGFDYQQRIYSAPMLSMLDLDSLVAELDWVMSEGAKIISLRPGPAFGRSPADPYFDPFWSRVNEAGICVTYHVGESGYNQSTSIQWGEDPNPSSHRQSAFQWCNFYCDRPIMDTISALIFHNLFGRFPNINIASIENGSGWVPYQVKALDKMGGMGLNGPWIGGRIKHRPSWFFKNHVFVSPFHEDDILGLEESIGATQVLFGSDYPHPEGLAVPVEFAESLATLSEQKTRSIMRENALALVGRA